MNWRIWLFLAWASFIALGILALVPRARAEDPAWGYPLYALRLSPEFWKHAAQEKRDLELLRCWNRCGPRKRASKHERVTSRDGYVINGSFRLWRRDSAPACSPGDGK
jgi:hypothetical protein